MLLSRTDPYVMCASPVIIDDITRRPENHVVASDMDDAIIQPEKWYAFNAGPAAAIPESCVSSGSCGGTTSGWIDHVTPSITDGVVDVTMCFSSITQCCSDQTNVLVRRCHGYVVYKFYKGIPSINARICVSKGRYRKAFDSFFEVLHRDKL